MGYVDDTKLLLALPPNQPTNAVSMLNDDLKEITKWCCRNLLLINPGGQIQTFSDWSTSTHKNSTAPIRNSHG